MANYKVKGIVLKRSNLGEADRILTIFTDKLGKIKAIGKGIRKQMSRSAGHLEPFCLSNLVIAEGKSLDIITEAETIECFYYLRNKLELTNLSCYLAEIIDKLTVEHEKHPDVFELFLEALRNVNQIENNLLIAYFESKLLSDLGFRPELKQCIKCHKKLGEINYFDYTDGGIVCQNCSSSGEKITNNAIKLLRIFHKSNIENIKKIKIDKKIVNEVKLISQKYIDYISGQEFKSRRFV